MAAGGSGGKGDDGFAAEAALGQRLERLWGLREVEDLPYDRAQHAVVNQGGDLAQLVAAGTHEEELVADAELLRLPPDPAAEPRDGQAQHRVETGFARERRVRRTGDSDRLPAGLEDAQ